MSTKEYFVNNGLPLPFGGSGCLNISGSSSDALIWAAQALNFGNFGGLTFTTSVVLELSKNEIIPPL